MRKGDGDVLKKIKMFLCGQEGWLGLTHTG